MSLEKASEEYLKLCGYVAGKQDGELMMYATVHQDTGIEMTMCNRQKLRRAILKSGRRYCVIPGVGYELAKPETVMPILTHGLRKIDSQVRRADASERVLRQRFFEQLTDEQQKAVMFLGAVFGTIRVAAEQGKELWSKKHEVAGGNPMLPIGGKDGNT